MRRLLGFSALALAVAGFSAMAYLDGKTPKRSGELSLQALSAPVSVTYDTTGVPHIKAQNETDLYRALGYVQAQDRLFQMEMLRRLARGQLAEVLGEQLVPTDTLFRTLRLDQQARERAATFDPSTPAGQALTAYLDGINQCLEQCATPLEFDLLGIPKRAFTVEDTYASAGYLAFSFANALRAEPVLSFIKDELGSDYLRMFDLNWYPEGVVDRPLAQADWQSLGHLAALSAQALEGSGLPQFEGSNAWAVAGSRTQSGKPLLASDPHIRFAVPSVWYEAHLQSPTHELYGHFQALMPVPLLGHNSEFGWGVTMFQNDDMDLFAEKVNPDNPQQVWHRGAWVELSEEVVEIKVKGAEPVALTLQSSPNGPIINPAMGKVAGSTPISLWWPILTEQNPILEGFYDLGRADTLAKARAAVEQIEAPGLNIMYANAKGDIAWWAAAKLPQRSAPGNPTFILDGSLDDTTPQAFHPFSANPQEENPSRGYILSANHQPAPASGIDIPGYYNLPDRAQRLNHRLSTPGVRWNTDNSRALQLDSGTAYGPRTLAVIIPTLRELVGDDDAQQALLDQLAQWDGDYRRDSQAASLFTSLSYAITRAAMADELGEDLFTALLSVRSFDTALPRLLADASSPWWNNVHSEASESRRDILVQAWQAALDEFDSLADEGRWGASHTLTHLHPLGSQGGVLGWVFNVGPLAAPGGHETPNNLSSSMGPAPWSVSYGPSTRRLIDFAAPEKSLGINPVGQSGVYGDQHYDDQAERYIRGEYRQQWLSEEDISRHSSGTLQLTPAP
ncbi:penicillin acylase family protein [Atopomonas sediminilitoris]|uniref:penicillin acylase family protein n=1 Tax=Atopomonas sediminilitoris TaxID=2919919 RepID=UPI001F4D8647|nr:penicillin acylase family protein [Atopomonas sediminilitoris]MCJ8170426.1 penicillin acylase family protein [Atopomonas sediminilitoris]